MAYKARHEAPKQRGNRLRDHARSIGRALVGATVRAWDGATIDAPNPREYRKIQDGIQEARQAMDTAQTPAGDLARAFSKLEQYQAGRGATERAYATSTETTVATAGTRFKIDVARGRGQVANPVAPAKEYWGGAQAGEDMLFTVDLGRSTSVDYKNGGASDELTVTLGGRESNQTRRSTVDTLRFGEGGLTATRAYYRHDGTLTPGHPLEVSNEQLTGLVGMVQAYADNPRQIFEEEAALAGAR